MNNNLSKLILILMLFIFLVVLIRQYHSFNTSSETFAGKKFTKNKLNRTLLKMIKLMNQYGIKDNWFISYGTLLGIIRNNSCIHNDDDVDIIIDKKHTKQLHRLVKRHKFKFIIKTDAIIKIELEPAMPTVDLYLSNVNNRGDFYDTHNNVIWSNSKPFQKKVWRGVILNIPNNYKQKLANRYGSNWRTPIDTKQFKYKKII